MPSGLQKLRYLALCDLVFACLAILLQLGVLIPLHQWVDWICIGFWGGVLLFLAGGAALYKRKKTIFFAVLAMMGGLAMIGFYSWNVSDIDCHDDFPIHNGTYLEKDVFEKYYDEYLCDWRLASDILFIILGCLIIVVNIGVSMTVSSLNDHDSRSRAPPPPPGPQTVQHPTTYIITSPPPANYGNPSTYPTQQAVQYSVNAAPYPQASYSPVQGTSTGAYDQPPPYNPSLPQKY